MEKDLLIEMGFEDEEEGGEEEREEGDDSEDEMYEDCIEENFEDLGTQIKNLQLQVENAMKEQFDVSVKKTLSNDHEHPEKISATSYSKKQNDTKSECKRNEAAAGENATTDKEYSELTSCNLSSEIGLHNIQEQTVSSAEDEAASTKDCFDTQSMWSASTTSTIAPHVIKRRIKLALDKREKKSQSRKILVKGEASAVTRVRRDNRATIKESTGIWGWE